MRRVLYDLSQLNAAQLAGTQPIVGGSGCLVWHSMRESTGSASARYILHDEGSSQHQALMDVTLSPGQSTRDPIFLHHLAFLGGLFITVPSGSITGSITCWVDHVCEDVLNWQIAVQQVEGAAALKALGLA